MATVPMISPNGAIGDVPADRAHEAVAKGFKLASDMISPTGKIGAIPFDRVHDAIKAGFQLKPPDGPQSPANPINSDASPDYSTEGLLTGAAKNLYQVSAPGILSTILNKTAPGVAAKLPATMRNNAAPPEQLPGQIVMNGAPMMLGDEVPVTERPSVPAPRTAPTPPSEGPGMLGRVAEVAKRRIGDNFAVKAAKDLNYIARGGGGDVPPPPAPPAPEVPANWGKGQFATPVKDWGKVITQPVADIVDKAVPESPALNLQTKTEVALKMSTGDTQGAAETIKNAAVKAGTRADLWEDKGIQEAMANDLEGAGNQARQAYAAEAEQYRYKAMREARRGRATAKAAPAKTAAASTPASTPGSDEDLTAILQQSLEKALKKRLGK